MTGRSPTAYYGIDLTTRRQTGMSCCSNNCNNTASSACALRNILNCLDRLSTQDLTTLREIIDRILECDS